VVMCDRFSYFCWAAPLSTLKLSTVIKTMDTWFHGVGFPQYIYSDSGPQFNAAKFKDYCAKHFITPLFSSVCFPQSNGLAEAAVKSVKYLLLKSENYIDFEDKLYDMQSIPLSRGTLSPAENKSPILDTSANPRTVFDPILHVAGNMYPKCYFKALGR
jgi:transposase InsO family protein